jgi:tRNA1(Val) A37 N6-methylase TrmN6
MKVINDLYDYQDYKIVQDTDAFKFSLDSILLAEFVDNVDVSTKILDLCTGNAVVPLILSYYYSNQITGFEIQESIFKLAKESLKINNVDKQINVINDDIKNIKNYFPGNNFDIITCNPPFFKNNHSLINENKEKAIARHELTLTLPELIVTVKYLLKENGNFYLVHRPDRLEEIMELCSKNNLRVKKLTFIYSKLDEPAIMVLLKCVKNGKIGMKVCSVIVNHDNKTYQNIFKNK